MISRLLVFLERGLRYTREHPQIFFVLILIFVMPLLFLYSGEQFLSVSRSNQDLLQKDRVGLMQDAFVSILHAYNYQPAGVQSEIDHIAALNPDILNFKIVSLQKGKFTTIAALATSTIGTAPADTDFYQNAAVRLDSSLIFEAYGAQGREWHAYRATQSPDGTFYFIYTNISRAQIDTLFAQKQQSAFITLIFIYLFVLALAYWHIKLTDYRYLYIKLRKADAMKDLFTNMIAHELRAPLTAIHGYASMILEQKKALAPEIVTYTSRVEDSAERLLGIVNDLLDVARIQSGRLAVTKQPFDASLVIIAVTDELKVIAQEKHIELTHTGAIETHQVVGDEKRLHQALTNLVSNAIKYTESGAIEVSIAETMSKVEIRVKDTGMGISAEDQKQLFAPFFRVQSDDVSKITGTGLGMWITKQLVELMGASIAVESIKGVGTHVVITLDKTEQPSSHA